MLYENHKFTLEIGHKCSDLSLNLFIVRLSLFLKFDRRVLEVKSLYVPVQMLPQVRFTWARDIWVSHDLQIIKNYE